MLYVSKDDQGVFSVGQGGDDLNPRAALAESALWELFDGGDPDDVPTELLKPST